MAAVRIGVKFKLLAYTTLVIGITSSLSAYLPYQYEKQELEQRLSKELLGIVQTASIAIDSERHENIFFDSEDGLEGKEDFEVIRALLADVSDINQLKRHPGLSPIYTLRSVSYDSSVLEFVVMTDTNEEGEYFSGAHIPKQDFHEEVLQGEARTTGIYQDSEGLWITASAPLKLADGSVVGIVQVDRPIDFYAEKLAELRNKFLLGAFIGVLFGLVVAYLFSRAFLNPIKVLLAATKNFSLGNYDYRIQQRRRDEYGTLYSSFNEMTDNLSSALDNLKKNNEELEVRAIELQSMALFAELNPAPVLRVSIDGEVVLSNDEADGIFQINQKSLHISVFISELSQEHLEDLIRNDRSINLLKHFGDTWYQFVVRGVSKFEFVNIYGSDITDRVLAEYKMKLAKEEAEEASHAKSRFLATMSHELRTPMNAIIGYTNLSKKKDLDDSLAVPLGRISTASHSLLGLINNILDFSKIEEDQLNVEKVDFSLENIVNELYIMFSQLSRERGVDLYFHSDRSLPKIVIGDPHRLKQVLMNLIGNAIKFTEKGAVTLRIFAADHADEIYFSVCDTGIGIDQKNHHEIFNPFTQSDSSTTRKYGGTGLGLSISQRLVDLMGGAIEINSELGQGSEFYFSLPILAGLESEKLADAPDEFECDDVTKILIVDNYGYAKSYFLNAFDQHCYACSFYTVDAIAELSIAEDEYAVIIYNSNRNDDLIGCCRLIGDISGFSHCTTILLFESLHEKWESQLDSVFDGKLDKPFLLEELIRIIERPESGGVVGFDEGGLGDSWREEACGLDGKVYGRTEAEAIEVIRQRNILIVEDDPVNQDLAQELMEYAGAKFSVAGDGQEAINMMLVDTFDLVLMDMQMPIMDGLTASQIIRQNSDWNAIPIIAVTANAISGDVERCLNAGMNDYVSKPIDDVILYQKMALWIQPYCVAETGVDHGSMPISAVSSSAAPISAGPSSVAPSSAAPISTGPISTGPKPARTESQDYAVDFSIVKAICGGDDAFLSALRAFVSDCRDIPSLFSGIDHALLKSICAQLDASNMCLALPQLQAKLFEISSELEKDECDNVLIEENIANFDDMFKYLVGAAEQKIQSVNDAAGESVEDFGVIIEGLDCNPCIQRFRGNKERYFKSLKSFYKNKCESANDVFSAFSTGDMEGARREAHTTKSLAATVGALVLQEKSASLEKAFLAGNTIDPDALDEYRLAFESTVKCIKKFLQAEALI